MNLLAVLLFCPTILSAADETRHITVTARSEVKVAPDEAVLRLEVNTRNKELFAAKRENDDISAALVVVASRHSIPLSDFKVTNLGVAPDYGRERGVNEIPEAYDFTRSFEVRITDFAKIEPFLSDAFAEGMSRISRLHFRVSNQRDHQFEARKLAVVYAREKAEHLTNLTGMKLGLPLSIEEDVESNWNAGGFGGAVVDVTLPSRRRHQVENASAEVVLTSLQQDGQAAISMDINSPGKITLTAEVTVKYEMFAAK